MLVRSLGFILIVIGNQWREQQNPHTVEGAEWVDKEKQLAQCLHFYPTFIYWIGQNVHSDFLQHLTEKPGQMFWPTQCIFYYNYIVAAVAAKSLQSCPTLCDPMDCSLPGFSIHGILQARTLEWVAISFSNA